MARYFALCQSGFLLGQSVRKADSDFVSCPTFHLIAWTDHKLVSVSWLIGLVWPATGSSIPPYWRYGTSGSG